MVTGIGEGPSADGTVVRVGVGFGVSNGEREVGLLVSGTPGLCVGVDVGRDEGKDVPGMRLGLGVEGDIGKGVGSGVGLSVCVGVLV